MPLSGIKILDMTRVLAGPFCTMLLADLGADVIKVETPQGDPARVAGIAGEGENPFFVNVNRNKRSIALNLRTEGGRAVIRRLAARADVLVENYRPGIMDRMGLGRESLQDINPRLIYAAVSGFGKTGPYSHRPAFDFIAQAVSGFMSLNGSQDMDPLRVGIPISDTIAGLYAAFGILAALHRRGRGGRGEEVQVAMVDSLMSMFTFASGAYFATGEQPPRTGNDHMVVAPYGVFHASDGPLAIAPSTEKNWLNLCRALDMEDVRQDARFATNRDRMRHRGAINRIVAERIAVRSREEWIELLNREGVPCGPINNLREAFSDPQVLHQQMVLASNQPSGRVGMPGFAVKMTEAPARLRRPSPQIGEHTEEVLAEAGFGRVEIEELRSEEVI